MKTSENLDQLATALAKAQAEMKNAKLNATNPHFKNKYANLAEIRDSVTPALTKYGIAVVQGTDTDGNNLAVFTRLIHASGQWIESRFPIPYDKPQTMGSGITYGRRYTLAAVTNIAADEDDDGNVANDGGRLATLPPVMPAANGTPGASKAGNRDGYAKMVAAIRNASSVKALGDWYKANVTEIDALPADWLDELRIEYADRKAELERTLAA